MLFKGIMVSLAVTAAAAAAKTKTNLLNVAAVVFIPLFDPLILVKAFVTLFNIGDYPRRFCLSGSSATGTRTVYFLSLIWSSIANTVQGSTLLTG
jgi:hypothetical protein